MRRAWMEDFTLLPPPGEDRRETCFTGMITQGESHNTRLEGASLWRLECRLLAFCAMEASPGDRIRREKDGTVWRVLDDMRQCRTPRGAGLDMSETRIERWL